MSKTSTFIAPELVARESRALIVKPEQAARWMDSIHTVREVLMNAEETFGILDTLIGDGDYRDQMGIPAVAALARRALASVADESETLLEVVDFLKPGKD